MRILVAYDGSEGADVAAQLVSELAWPEGSTVELAFAVATRAASPPPHVLSSQAGRVPRQTALEEADQAAARSARWLSALPNATFSLYYGRAAPAIADEAAALGADVIVVGSRGRGPYASLLLGSVSTEIVDRAPCPVIVARTSAFGHVVLATDGSAAAELATTVVGTWPMFESAQITVVSVGDARDERLISPTYRESSTSIPRPDHVSPDPVTIAARTARRLRSEGRRARATLRVGDP